MPDIARGQAGTVLTLTNHGLVVTNELVMSPAGAATFTHPSGAGLVLSGVQQDTKLAAFDDNTRFRVDIAFRQAALLETDPPWTSISTDVRDFRISRGRSNEIDTYGPGTLHVTVDNNQGHYTPTVPSATYYPNIKPMRQIRVQAVNNGTTYDLFRGYVERWPLAMPDQRSDVVVPLQASDGFKILNNVFSTSTQAQETAHVRIGHLLDDVSWPVSMRDLSTSHAFSTSEVGAYTPGQQDVLSMIHKAADVTRPSFFIAADGKATLKDRAGLVPTVFVNSHINAVSLSYDDEQIWNHGKITLNASSGTVTRDGTTASQDDYGIRTLVVNDALFTSTTAANSLFASKLGSYDSPWIRAESITVKPGASSSTDTWWDLTLPLELNDRVSLVVSVPPSTHVNLASHFVDSLEHKVVAATKTWDVTFSMSKPQF